jgi:hypothetical protein
MRAILCIIDLRVNLIFILNQKDTDLSWNLVSYHIELRKLLIKVKKISPKSHSRTVTKGLNLLGYCTKILLLR